MERPAETTMELAYVGVQVGDCDGLNALFRDVVGLVPGPSVNGAATWRNDHKAYRIVVDRGPANDAAFMGFELGAESFDAAVERLAGLGVPITPASPAQLVARKVDRLVRFASPWGAQVELVTGLADAEDPFESPLVPGGFVTEGMGFGHLVFQVGSQAAMDESHRFALDVLGLKQSDWFEGHMGPVPVFVRFYHCNARHHTLAIGYSPAGAPPNALNHIMLQTVSEENVGVALDRARAAGVPIDAGLGRHDNDQMFSFYMATPFGFRVELGYGAREISQPWTEDRRYDRPSVWGHVPEGPPPAP